MGAVERLLRLFPGLLAGGLALVYVLGAIVTGSEFAGADIDPSDAVPLLSIEQLLARGIGVLVRPSTFLTVFVLFLILGSVLLFQNVFPRPSTSVDREAEAETTDRHRASLPVEIGRDEVGLAAALLIAMAALVPVNQLLGSFILSAGTWLAAISAFGSRSLNSSQRSAVAVLVLASFVLALGVIAYTDPSPRADARLELLRGANPPKGVFVTHSNSTWYLFDEALGEIQAFPDEIVRTAFIEKRVTGSSNDDKSLAGYALDGLEEISPF